MEGVHVRGCPPVLNLQGQTAPVLVHPLGPQEGCLDAAQSGPLLQCPSPWPWAQDDHPGPCPWQLPIAFLIYSWQRGDVLLTAVSMGSSTVIARGERQALRSHKRESAPPPQMLLLSFRVAGSLPQQEPPKAGLGFPGFLIISILNLGFEWFIFVPLGGDWARGEGVTVFHACFLGLPVCGVMRVQWQELLTGSGPAQQPVTTADQLGVHGLLSLPIQSDSGVGQKEKNETAKPKATPKPS